MYVIEKGIPYTKEGKRITKDMLPLDKLNPGDSIDLEPKADEKVLSRWYARLNYFKKHYHINGRFKLGKDKKNHLRLWRLEDDMKAA